MERASRAVFHAERPIPAKTQELDEQVANQLFIIDDEDRFLPCPRQDLPGPPAANGFLAGSWTTRLTPSTSTSSDSPFG